MEQWVNMAHLQPLRKEPPVWWQQREPEQRVLHGTNTKGTCYVIHVQMQTQKAAAGLVGEGTGERLLMDKGLLFGMMNIY